MKKIIVLDTTLRDGEQVPGAKLSCLEKVEIARQLENLGVDIIEAGFPASSPGDFEAVKVISEQIKNGPMITGLARAVKADIDAVYQSVREAQKPLIHMVLGTSDVHVSKKFMKSRDEILQIGVDAVKYAKTLLPDVQYSTEDASRSEFEYLWATIEAVVKAGATMINIPDTVGYAVPEEFGVLISRINDRLRNINPDVLLSVHCHNDTGLAVANTLAAIKNGANKVECTINGIGERAGNAALEEIVMGLKVRSDYYQAITNIKTTELYKTSRMVSGIMGLDVQANKAIIGDNAFAHSSGIHQDGLLKAREVYEIISPSDVGVDSMEIVLTARSGRKAFSNVLNHVGYTDFAIESDSFGKLFTEFLKLADRKKEVYIYDVFYLVEGFITAEGLEKELAAQNYLKDKIYYLEDLQVVSNDQFPTATVKLRQNGKVYTASSFGDGPIDALFTAISEIMALKIDLLEYKINSISRGKEAMGRAMLKLSCGDEKCTARATDTDIIKASALAFINGINQILVAQK